MSPLILLSVALWLVSPADSLQRISASPGEPLSEQALLTGVALPPRDEHKTLFQIYKHHISSIDGERCPMHPSCSEYALQAIKKYGLFKGSVLICDRLTRCGSDLYLYQEVRVEGRTLYSDPLEANDQLFRTDK